MSTWHWPGSVAKRIVDGDTIIAEVTRDLGFGGRTIFEVKLRLNRINAAKESSAAGHAAEVALGLLLAGQVLDMTTVGPYKYGTDESPGEWMVEITLPDGRNVSDALVTMGHAVYWDGRGPRPADG